MSDNVKMHIGIPEDMGRRFVDAWHRAERGEIVDETNITFRDLETLLTALTPKRLHLLRYVLMRFVTSELWRPAYAATTRMFIRMWTN